MIWKITSLIVLAVLAAWFWTTPGGGRDLYWADEYISYCMDDTDSKYDREHPRCAVTFDREWRP